MNLTLVERVIIETSYWNRKRSWEISDLFTGINQYNKTILNIGAGRLSDLVRTSFSTQIANLIQIDIEKLEGIDIVADAIDLPSITKEYNSDFVIPSTTIIFFVNELCVMIICKHVGNSFSRSA